MSDLPRRPLGRTGLDVTTLGYGAMELRNTQGAPAVSEGEASRLLNEVLDAGINLIDTSPDYGQSEELIGRSIAHRRDEYILASKCGCVPGAAGGAEHVHTAANIRAGVEQSLRRMRTDHLDIVQFHRSLTPREFEQDGALAEALRLRDEGKVRFVGVSGTLPNLDAQISMGVFDIYQIPYSLLQRDHEEVIARASAAGAGILIRGGVARGTPSDWEGRTYYMRSTTDMRDEWDQAGLDDLLDGMTRIEFTLRFTLAHDDLDTTIVGTANAAHLRANLATARVGPLPSEVVSEVKRRLDAVASNN
jgi:aryl-alcohol dehydrogenase-like predicted oxidoreductase